MADDKFFDVEFPKAGLRNFRRALDKAGKALAVAVTPDVIGSVLVERIKKRMVQGVSPDGSPFAALDQETIKWRKWAIANPGKAGYNGSSGMSATSDPLIFSGRLYKSIRIDTAAGLRINTGSGFRIVTDAQSNNQSGFYGFTHEFGTFDIPARPFLGINENDATAVAIRMERAYATGA